MDEAKDYFLKHPELNCMDTVLWGQMQGQTPATYTSHSQRKEEPYKRFPIGYERVRVAQTASQPSVTEPPWDDFKTICEDDESILWRMETDGIPD